MDPLKIKILHDHIYNANNQTLNVLKTLKQIKERATISIYTLS